MFLTRIVVCNSYVMSLLRSLIRNIKFGVCRRLMNLIWLIRNRLSVRRRWAVFGKLILRRINWAWWRWIRMYFLLAVCIIMWSIWSRAVRMSDVISLICGVKFFSRYLWRWWCWWRCRLFLVYCVAYRWACVWLSVLVSVLFFTYWIRFSVRWRWFMVFRRLSAYCC